jgi:PHD/YefM family antitoxin component YafN of YafNO toxin-antitoxin module
MTGRLPQWRVGPGCGIVIRCAILAYEVSRERRPETGQVCIALDTREVHSLTDFLRNHKAHLARLKQTHAPEVLMVNGRAEVVVQDAASYQAMLDRLHHMETIAAIQEGMASAERGELKPAAQVLDEMRAKYGLSR